MIGRAIVIDRCATARPARPGALAIFIARADDLLATWRSRWRQRRQLHALSDHMLKDMGLSRYDADHEAGKRFWRG